MVIYKYDASELSGIAHELTVNLLRLCDKEKKTIHF